MDQRLTELEIKLAECEDHITELNKAAFRQQQQIDLLQAQLRELYRLIQAQQGPQAASEREELPPHY